MDVCGGTSDWHSLHLRLPTFLLRTAHLLKPSKTCQNLRASSGLSRFTNAYPRLL